MGIKKNKEIKKSTYLFLMILFFMLMVTGGTYAYFALSATNENVVVGTAATASLDLQVEKILPSGVPGVMVPQLESALGSAISTNYSCVDNNGNTVCQVYKATITNISTATVRLNGSIKFTGINNMPNLKWKRITDERTVGQYSSQVATTSAAIFESNRAFLKNESEVYYFVIWIDEAGSNQTDSGTFRVTIEFNPTSGNGLTSTIGSEETQGTLATTYIENKFNDGSSISEVDIGDDSSNPTVYLNRNQGIMIDNNGEIRYYGANPNNYVSFNGELWRIISVSNVKSSNTDTTGELRVKIVKADILKDDNDLSEYSWDFSDESVNYGFGVNDWSKSDLMSELNTLYFNSTNGICSVGDGSTGLATELCSFRNTGLSQEAKNLTADALYYLGGIEYAYLEEEGAYADFCYISERGTVVFDCGAASCGGQRSTYWIGRVGIIYLSDYAYATDLDVCTETVDYYDAEECISNNWLSYPRVGDWQWSLSASSDDNSVFGNDGYVASENMYYPGTVLPVLYLKSDVKIVGGEGSSGKPYLLSGT